MFPLGTVLFPGLLLPLHIFEDRYRQLVRDLVRQPEPQRFGVIAIREGRETGIDGVSALYEIGCTATLRRVSERDDGRFDLVTVGADRFRLTALDDSEPYLQGDVEFLPEDTGDETGAGIAVGAQLWSAAACFRFPPRELARGTSNAYTIPRQQAGLWQSGSKLPHSKAAHAQTGRLSVKKAGWDLGYAPFCSCLVFRTGLVRRRHRNPLTAGELSRT